MSVCDAASQTPHRRPSGDSPAHRREHLGCWQGEKQRAQRQEKLTEKNEPERGQKSAEAGAPEVSRSSDLSEETHSVARRPPKPPPAAKR